MNSIWQFISDYADAFIALSGDQKISVLSTFLLVTAFLTFGFTSDGSKAERLLASFLKGCAITAVAILFLLGVAIVTTITYRYLVF